MNNDFFNDSNSGNDDSSRHFGKSKEQSQKRIKELEELLKKIAAEAKAKKMEYESQFFDDLRDTLHGINFSEGDEGYFADNQKSSNDFWQFFKKILDYFGVYTGEGDFKTYSMLKEKKEKGWLLSMLDYVGRRIKTLVQAILGYDSNLNWKEQLDKEIKELSAKIEKGELMGQELMNAMRRLELLRDIKFKFQMFAIGWLSEICASFVLDELLTPASQEQDKQVEKEPLKEKEVATKEVRKNVETEVKVAEKEKPQSVPDVNPMQNIQPIKIIVPLATKEELSTLPKPSINLFFHVQEQTISNRNNEVPKPKVEEEKKAEPKKEMCSPIPNQPRTNTQRVVQEGEEQDYGANSNAKLGRNGVKNAKVKPQRGSSPSSENFPKANPSSAESETQQSSVSNAQPASNCSNVEIQEVIQQEGRCK